MSNCLGPKTGYLLLSLLADHHFTYFLLPKCVPQLQTCPNESAECFSHVGAIWIRPKGNLETAMADGQLWSNILTITYIPYSSWWNPCFDWMDGHLLWFFYWSNLNESSLKHSIPHCCWFKSVSRDPKIVQTLRASRAPGCARPRPST